MSTSPNPFWLRLAPQFLRQRLQGKATLHDIIQNTGWLLADKFLRLGMGLLVSAWVARYLGPSQYGELAYVLSVVVFFQVLSQLGLDGIAIRDMARDREAASAILGTVFRLRIITGFFCWLGAVGLMALFRPGDSSTLLLTAIVAGSLVFQAADTVDLWFQSQTQSKRTVLAKTISYLLNSLFKISLILSNAPLLYFAIAGLAEIAMSAIALYVSYGRFPAPVKWAWDIGWGKRLLKESWPYMLSGLAITIYMRIDQIMLREMLGTHELGIFSAALPFSTTWYFIPMMIAQSTGASIAKKKQSDRAGYERAIDRLFSLMWWIMLPLCIAIALLSVPIIKLLYGEAYSESSNVLAVHCFANIPIALGVMQGIWIVNERKNMLSLALTVIGAITNIGLNFFMIPKYGALGVAAATVASHCVSVFSTVVFAPQIFRRQFLSLLWFK
ncbi:MAG: flippase [Chlorobium sp.]|nr:MAG: flippase [Chlorobium sp.]